jgi:pyruvate formate lyase activating enzyme
MDSIKTINKEVKTSKRPNLFSVQHFCLHDGPGTRSIIFFKGCPLRCVWCQNPESWSLKTELAYKHTLCIDCKTCVEVCPEKAISAPGEWDEERCTLCFKCVDACPSGAMTRFGEDQAVAEVLDKLRPEYPFYKSSAGGVTLSGGEVTLFPDYASDIAKHLRNDGIHVLIETCGQFKLEKDAPEKLARGIVGNSIKSPVWKLLSQIDLILFDIKVFDSEKHKVLCGTANDEIKQNFSTLAQISKNKYGPKIWPRLPLIPGMTDSTDNLTNWAAFLLEHGISQLTIVPYHNLGSPKRAWIGVEPAPDIPSLSDEALNQSIQILTKAGIQCYAPGEEDWEHL